MRRFVLLSHRMRSLFLAACLVGLAISQTARPLDSIIADILKDTDRNQDGLIQNYEFAEEFLTRFSNGEERISRADFILTWTLAYGEDPKIAGQFFDNLDAFTPIGELNELDILMDYPTLDIDGDGIISSSEFTQFIHKKHPDGNNVQTTTGSV